MIADDEGGKKRNGYQWTGARHFEDLADPKQVGREAAERAVRSLGSIKLDSSITEDPQKLKAFEAAQGELSSALSRLLVVSERYPDLKSTAAFRDLQAQLEGTENRIAVARRRYVQDVASYNKVVLTFPSSIGASMRNKKERPTFSAAPGADKVPEINFE